MKLVALVLVLAACHREPAHVAVGVAASLRDAMPELVAAYRREAGIEIDVTYGASDRLAAQMRHGSALDALVLAKAVPLDALVDEHLIAEDSRRIIASNTIVLVGPARSGIRFASLATLPPGDKIAIGDPATVPVGRYAQRYLEQLGAWHAVQPRLVLGGDAAGVLALAMQGRARVAVVYRTDVREATALAVLDEPTDAPTASIVAGVATHSPHADRARAFDQFLRSRDGQQILARYGFAPPRD